MKPKILIVAEDSFDRELHHFIVPCDYGTATDAVFQEFIAMCSHP